MKAQGIKLTTLLLMLFCASLSYAQLNTNTHYPARKGGFWTLGINGGGAYQSSDVARLYEGWGAGLTLGKNLYYRPGAAFSFDMRGRLHYDVAYGLDSKRSYGLAYNNTLNGNYYNDLNYIKGKGGNGYVFSNHRTRRGELSLEGVLRLNRLREKTGIVAAIYGGVGINAYSVMTDQLSFNKNYASAYAGIDTSASRSTIRQQLQSTLDGDYESDGDGNEYVQWGIMPSLGYEIGYQFAPRFHASLGHRITYSLRDNLDGQRWNNNNQATENNDRLNYTYLKMEWELNKVKSCNEPKITILAPIENPYITEQATAKISAKIENVNNSLDIVMRHNSVVIDANFYNPRLNQDVNLKPGRNEIELIAKNPCGEDRKIIIITYNPPRSEPKSEPEVVEFKEEYPKINIDEPTSDYTETYENSRKILATAKNITRKNQVVFMINGRSTNDFNFNENGVISKTISLDEGKNNVQIRVKNTKGEAADEVVIVRKRDIVVAPPPPARTLTPPRVTITTPSRNRTTTMENTTTVRANIDNISYTSDISFTINGRRNNNFSFERNVLTANISLAEGENNISIKVHNEDGNDEANTIIIKESRVERPEISISSPRSGTRFDVSRCELEAYAKNVSSKNELTVSVNNRNIDFVYSPISKKISADITLVEGNNTILVRANTADGSDEKSVTVSYRRATPAPNVRIISPNNGSTTEQATATLRAKVANVNNQNEVKVSLNNKNIDFRLVNDEVTATLNLQQGNNTITINVSNEGGNDRATSSMNYRKPVVAPPTPTDPVIRNPRTPKEEVPSTTGRNPRTETPATSAGDDVTEGPKKQYPTDAVATKPTITITSLSQNVGSPRDPANGQCTLIATLKNAPERGKITVTLNGELVKFSYDTNSGVLNSQFQLAPGENTVRIKAMNKFGTTEIAQKTTY